MLNNFFTLMNRSIQTDYGRQIEHGIYRPVTIAEELHNLLVPQSDDKYSASCVEQILQYVLESAYVSRLEELDPLNTYSTPILVLSDDAYTVVNPEAIGVLVLNEEAGDPNWCQKSFSVTINPISLIASVSALGIPTKEYIFTMTNNLSSKILLADNIYMRLQGTLPAAEFVVSVRYDQKFIRDINTLLTTAETLEIPWHNVDYTIAYQKSLFALEKISILTMNLYEILKDASNS